MTRTLLYFSAATTGGLADYAREQANAMARLGVRIHILSSEGFPFHTGDMFKIRPELTVRARAQSRLLDRLGFARLILQNFGQLARIIEEGNYQHVLFGSYAEYLAPLWSGRFLRLALRGVTFGVIVHDPVRDHVVGPRAWHRQSIAAGYSFAREAFVHEQITLDTVRPMPNLRTTVIPQGIYSFPAATATRSQFRHDLGIPDGAEMWLSFGHIRDGKNLDLAIRALALFPEAFLVVAGKEQSRGQRPVKFYQELAQKSEVAHRCLWLNRFIAPEDVGNLFEASDLVLLTYSKTFRSASAVLNTAAHFRKPCLASSGQGNLQTMISKYQLGLWVEPDNLEALIAGIRLWRLSPPAPHWEAYEKDNSWRKNAEIVVTRMFETGKWRS